MDVAGAEARDFSTSWASTDCSMPVPRTAMLLFVNVDAAKDLMSAASKELWAGAKREEPSPVRKARACARSRASVAGSAVALATSP